MAKLEVHREYPEMSSDECFKQCISLVDTIGYTLFKKRDIANLIICNRTLDNNLIDLSLTVAFGDPANVGLNLSSDGLDEAALTAESERIFNILSDNLKS